mgnify:FL=1
MTIQKNLLNKKYEFGLLINYNKWLKKIKNKNIMIE